MSIITEMEKLGYRLIEIIEGLPCFTKGHTKNGQLAVICVSETGSAEAADRTYKGAVNG